VGLLKKLLGNTDAMADARKRAVSEEGEEAAPAGWNVTSPDVEQTDDEVILRMAAPGLDASSFEHSVDDDALVLKAHGTNDTGAKINLNERFKIKGADLSQATLTYEDGKIVVRLPKSAFPSQPSA
jgi:HSP20 family molecular chaperone IbpA